MTRNAFGVAFCICCHCLMPMPWVLTAQETIEIQVKAGWKEGTRITYPGKGDALPGRPAQVCAKLSHLLLKLAHKDGPGMVPRAVQVSAFWSASMPVSLPPQTSDLCGKTCWRACCPRQELCLPLDSPLISVHVCMLILSSAAHAVDDIAHSLHRI